MIFAVAALLLHLGPVTDTRIVTDVAAATAASAKAANAPSAPAAPPAAALAASAPKSIEPAASAAEANPALADGAINTDSLSTIRLPEPASAKPIRVIAAETTPPRKSWLLLSLAQHGAAAFDAYTTRQAVSAGAHEDDPLIRPFADSPAIYVVSQIAPTALDYAARRMQRSQHAFLRHSWWLPQSASTALFIFAGTHNLGVAASRTAP